MHIKKTFFSVLHITSQASDISLLMFFRKGFMKLISVISLRSALL